MRDADNYGRFEARWDGSMIAFGIVIPRRITLAEAGDLCASLLQATTDVRTEGDTDLVRTCLQELAEYMHREQANNNQKGAEHE